jgi:hypothetical protein
MTVKNSYFNYLSPKIFPVFPKETGNLHVLTSPQFIIDTRAGVSFTGKLEITFIVYMNGRETSSEALTFEFENSKTTAKSFVREFKLANLGLLEIHCNADAPIFKKIIPEPGYGILKRPNGSSISINRDMKYAHTRVIEQMRHHNRFCMLHSAALSDGERGIGNSILLGNPYDQPLVTRLRTQEGKLVSEKLLPHSVKMIDLHEVVVSGSPQTIMITANNRVLTFDVKHYFGDQARVNSVDHLDPYSGFKTHRAVDLLSMPRFLISRLTNQLNLR